MQVGEQLLPQAFGSGMYEDQETPSSPLEENDSRAGLLSSILCCSISGLFMLNLHIVLNHPIAVTDAGTATEEVDHGEKDLAELLDDLDIVAQASPLAADVEEQVCAYKRGSC